MGVRRKGPPLRFSVEAVSSRKLGSRVLGTGKVFMVPLVFRSPRISSQETATSSSASGNSISRVLYLGGHQEDFGTFGSDSPASPFLTSLASKSAKGTMSPTRAFSRAFT